MAPGANQVTGIGIGEVQLDALVNGAAEPAAEVVPGEPALKGVLAAARGRLPVDNTALVVLGEGAGGFFEDGGSGIAPAFDAAGLVEVLEEVGLECGAIGELARDINDVVLQGVEEVSGGDFGGEEAGVGGAGGRGGGQGIGGEDEQGDIEQSSHAGRRGDEEGGRNRHRSFALKSSRLKVAVSRTWKTGGSDTTRRPLVGWARPADPSPISGGDAGICLSPRRG